MINDTIQNPELDMLRANKQSGFNYRERRHDDWTENYTLYRDKVITDRLIQRQTVNIPLMKQVIRTLLKDVDDMPVLYFENLDDDKQAEKFKNEYWNITVEENNMEVQDIVDKKQVFHFGRSFDQWQIVNGKVKQTIVDPMDILIDRYADPTNIDTARFLIHTHIFTPLSVIERNEMYDKEEVHKLKMFHASELGLLKAASNQEMLEEKNEKMADLGLDDVDSPILGETYVELSLHFVKRAESESEEEQYYMYVEADDMSILMKKPLEEVIGKTKDNFWRTHLNYCTWADDVERQDFWSDGVADIVRPANKVVNAWFSQLVENRTLRNFGMQYFDSSIEGFNPGTYQARPFGWYGVPGNPNEIIKRIEIPDLSESLDEMNFVMTLMERATGATATQQGVQTQKQITLGEVQLALGEAKERIKGMSKFYTPAWKRRGLLFTKLIEAGADKLDAVKLFKKGKNTDSMYSREIAPKDWMTENGYRCKVWSMEEKNTNDTNTLQKMNLAKQNMPNNQKLNEIYQRKILEFTGLTPEEINAVMETEQEMQQAMAMSQQAMLGATTQMPPQQQPIPQQNPLQGMAIDKVQALKAM